MQSLNEDQGTEAILAPGQDMAAKTFISLVFFGFSPNDCAFLVAFGPLAPWVLYLAVRRTTPFQLSPRTFSIVSIIQRTLLYRLSILLIRSDKQMAWRR